MRLSLVLFSVYLGEPQVRSIVSEVFEGMLESRVKCLSCKKVTNHTHHGKRPMSVINLVLIIFISGFCEARTISGSLTTHSWFVNSSSPYLFSSFLLHLSLFPPPSSPLLSSLLTSPSFLPPHLSLLLPSSPLPPPSLLASLFFPLCPTLPSLLPLPLTSSRVLSPPGRKEMAKSSQKMEGSGEPKQDPSTLSRGFCTVWNFVTSLTRDLFVGPPTDIRDCLNAFFDTSELKGTMDTVTRLKKCVKVPQMGEYVLL